MSTRLRIRAALAIVALIAVALAVAGCAAGATKLKAADSGKSITLAKDATVAIELESNPTTGYDWFLDGALPSQLTTASDDFASSGGPNVVGAGGVRTITYRAVASGTATVKLVYKQPWAGGQASDKTFTVTVTVP